MRQHSSVRLNLTPRQVKILSKKEAVVIKPDQLDENGEHEINLSVVKHKKMKRNAEKQKGYRLKLDETEGGSFMQRIGLHLSKGKPIKDVVKTSKQALSRPERPKLLRSGPPVISHGSGISLPLTKENLIRASDPIINVGGIYFDSSRFIRPDQPPFKPTVHTAIEPVGNWT